MKRNEKGKFMKQEPMKNFEDILFMKHEVLIANKPQKGFKIECYINDEPTKDSRETYIIANTQEYKNDLYQLIKKHVEKQTQLNKRYQEIATTYKESYEKEIQPHII